MSQKDVKKFVFCSLDEYKTMEKETGAEYIIDAADISEAITNSESTEPSNPSVSEEEPSYIWQPYILKEFQVQNVAEPASFAYKGDTPDDLYRSRPLIFNGTLKTNQLKLLNGTIDYNSMILEKVNVPDSSYSWVKNEYLVLRVPLDKSKVPFFNKPDGPRFYIWLSSYYSSYSSSAYYNYSVGNNSSSRYNQKTFYDRNEIYQSDDPGWCICSDDQENLYLQSSRVDIQKIKDMQEGPEKESAIEDQKRKLFQFLQDQNNIFYFGGIQTFEFNSIYQIGPGEEFNWQSPPDGFKIRFRKLMRTQ